MLALLTRAQNAGMRRFYLAGSVGMEDPRHVNRLFHAIRERWPDMELGFHVHNLAGIGTANILAALDGAAISIEGSICGDHGDVECRAALTLPGYRVAVQAGDDLLPLGDLIGDEPGELAGVAMPSARPFMAS